MLRLDGLLIVSAKADAKPAPSWSCWEIVNADGVRAVEEWMAENREALSAPDRIVPLEVLSAGQLFRLHGDGSYAQWPLWYFKPGDGPAAHLSKAELLHRVWTQNLTLAQLRRLHGLFEVHGRQAVSFEAPPRRGNEPTRGALVPERGTFVLRVSGQQSDDGSTAWASLAIGQEPAREAVRQWILANYDALKCAKALSPGVTGLKQKQLHWLDERRHAWVDLLEAVRVGKPRDGEPAQWVEVLPACEVEYLTRLFRQYGVATTFAPDPLDLGRGPSSEVELFAP